MRRHSEQHTWHTLSITLYESRRANKRLMSERPCFAYELAARDLSSASCSNKLTPPDSRGHEVHTECVRNVLPFLLTYSPILSAIDGSRPFSSVISFFTSVQGSCKKGHEVGKSIAVIGFTLSNLSTAEEIARIFSGGTPHTWKIPSSSFR